MGKNQLAANNPANVQIFQTQRTWIGFTVGERRVARVSDQGVIEILMTRDELHDLWVNGPDQQSKMMACILMQLSALQERVYGNNMLLIAEDVRGMFARLHKGHGITEIA